MPITREIIAKEKLVVTRCHGEMQIQDMALDQLGFWSQDWVSEYSELFMTQDADFSGIIDLVVSHANKISAHPRYNNPTAIIATGKNKPVADMFIEIRDASGVQHRSRVFEEEEAGRAWLAINDHSVAETALSGAVRKGS